MKKLFATVISAALVMSLCACGSNTAGNTNTKTDDVATSLQTSISDLVEEVTESKENDLENWINNEDGAEQYDTAVETAKQMYGTTFSDVYYNVNENNLEFVYVMGTTYTAEEVDLYASSLDAQDATLAGAAQTEKTAAATLSGVDEADITITFTYKNGDGTTMWSKSY